MHLQLHRRKWQETIMVSKLKTLTPNLGSLQKLVIVSASLLIASCASSPTLEPAVVSERSITTEPITPNEKQSQDTVTPLLDERNISIERAQYYHDLAQSDSGQSKIDSQLSAAENYIQAKDYLNAEQRINELERNALTKEQQDRLSIINAYIAFERQDFYGALNMLEPVIESIKEQHPIEPELPEQTVKNTDQTIIPVEQTVDGIAPVVDEFGIAPKPRRRTRPKMLNTQQVDALLLSSFCHQQLGDFDSAINALLIREGALVGRARSETTRYIWQVIDSISIDTRQSMIANSANPMVVNRLEQSLQGQVSQQNFAPQQFSQWQKASNNKDAQNVIDDNWNVSSPQNIAVLLPLSSKFNKAAQAVMDGIKYQNQLNTSAYKPQLQFYDIGQNAIQAPQYYNAAINAGADFVIGPLGANFADQVSNLSGLRVPTLLLGGESRIGGSTTRLALSPELEGLRAAERALEDGHLSVAILANTSVKNQRIIDAFSSHWLAHGGKINTVVNYDKAKFDHSAELKQLFDITRSESRHQSLSTTLGFKPKFSAYQRNDLDFIFMLADNDSGRIVRPQINFFSGSKIPVYSTSGIFNGIPDSINNIDLDNTRFPIMPWVFKSKDSAAYAGQLNRLFAMGADAYLVAGNFSMLRGDTQLALNANTGQISINEKSHIESKPLWAKFTNGDAVLLDASTIDLRPVDKLGQPLNDSLNGINTQSTKGIYNDKTWNTRESRRTTSP